MAASTEQLHTHASEAEKHAEQLATGLAEIGAGDDAVKAVTQCAEVLRKVATGLAKGMKDEEPEPQPTMADAADRMMAARAQPPAA
jgi:cobalamin biosynthesis protein CbiD